MKFILFFILISYIYTSYAFSGLESYIPTESINSISNTFLSYIYGEKCEYNKNLSVELPKYLATHIGAQQEALSMIEKTFANWDYLRQNGLSQPLALAITGPSGVGKTETANRISDILYEKSSKCGTLILRGEDYSSAILQAEGRSKLFNMLKNRIVNHIIKTNGNSFIIFDEIQKVSPGLLEVLIPALEEDGSLSYTKYTETSTLFNIPFLSTSKSFVSTSTPSTDVNEDQALISPPSSSSHTSTPSTSSIFSTTSTIREEISTVSTKNCIFLFISDIGADYMIKFLIKNKKRSLLDVNHMRKIIKKVLDKQWKRLKLSTKINEIFFFLPLEKVHIREILMNKIYNKNELIVINRHTKYIYIHPNIVDYLISNQFIEYSIFSLKEGESTSENEKKEEKIDSGIERAVSSIFEDIDADIDDEIDSDSNNSSAIVSPSSQPSTTTSSKTISSDDVVPEDELNQKIFAIRGARAISNAGPLKDLRSLILQKMRPWRTNESINIGYIDKDNIKKAYNKWGATDVEIGDIFLQWCNLDETLISQECKKVPNNICPALQVENGLHEFYAFSPLCETIYYGKLNESY